MQHAVLSVSYQQFMMYDRVAGWTAVLWTSHHLAQGFALNETQVAMSTLVEWGRSDFTIVQDSGCPIESYDRVIQVPLSVPSGYIVVSTPDMATEDAVIVAVERGSVLVTVAQARLSENAQACHLFVSSAPSSAACRILRGEEGWDPPSDLLETAQLLP